MPGKSSLWALLLPQTLNDREIQDMLSKVRFSDIHSESRDNFSNPNSLITLEILVITYICEEILLKFKFLQNGTTLLRSPVTYKLKTLHVLLT